MRKNCSKVIIENFFEPCILFLLEEKPCYGYELKNNLSERCGCQVNIGNLYRGLGKLEKNQYVTKEKTVSDIGPDRITYRITPNGKKLLKEWIEELETGAETIQKLITNYKKLYATHHSK